MASQTQRPWQVYRDRAITNKRRRLAPAPQAVVGSWLDGWNQAQKIQQLKHKQEKEKLDAVKTTGGERKRKVYAVVSAAVREADRFSERQEALYWVESRPGARWRIFWDDEKAKTWIEEVVPHLEDKCERAEEVEKPEEEAQAPVTICLTSSPPPGSMSATVAVSEGKAEAEAEADRTKTWLRPPPTSISGPPGPPRFQPSPEQLHAKRLAVQGRKSLFITGGAGTGKSVVLRDIVRSFQARHFDIAVTATTGIAGLNIGGATIHSWAGIGLGNGTPAALAEKIQKKRDLRLRWETVEVLVIDEVSMLDPLLFDKLEAVARLVRRDQRPFGGIQLVLCGDFFQLPPVVVETRTNGHLDPELELKQAYLRKRSAYRSNFVFDAQTWSRCVGEVVVLHRVFRQTEHDLVRHLERLRRGHVDEEITRFFSALERPIDCSDGIQPAELFSRKKEVDEANRARLEALHGFPYRFQARDVVNPDVLRRIGDEERGRYANIYLSELKRSVIAPEHIELRAGAQVMLTKNLTNGLVNGSFGVIVGFVAIGDRAVVEDLEGNLWIRGLGSKGRVQIARSAVGSKNRAAQDVAAEIDAGTSDNDDEDDEARKRARTVAAAPLPLFAARIKAFSDASLRRDRQWPLVRFSKGLAADETVEMVVTAMAFDFESAVTGKTVATRHQVPLILAWAISIHKGQGQTLPRVKVNLGSVFECGQAYVALSRATCIEGLQVINFSPEKIFAEERVVEWYRELEENQGRGDVDTKAGSGEIVKDAKEMVAAEIVKNDKEMMAAAVAFKAEDRSDKQAVKKQEDDDDDKDEVVEIDHTEFYRKSDAAAEVGADGVKKENDEEQEPASELTSAIEGGRTNASIAIEIAGDPSVGDVTS